MKTLKMSMATVEFLLENPKAMKEHIAELEAQIELLAEKLKEADDLAELLANLLKKYEGDE